jgi:uncharacterized protein (TIGR00661 family)
MTWSTETNDSSSGRRIVYAVHGYGRGHATRSMAMLAELRQRHRVLVLAGGDAYAAIAAEHPVLRIPTLGFAYGRNTAVRSNLATLRLNAGAVLDLACRGAVFEMVADAVRAFAPDAVISDAEAWSHRVARHLGVPRIGFDHIGLLAWCRPAIDPSDRIEAMFDAWVYRALMGRPDRMLVSSFFAAPAAVAGVRVVPTLARQAVRTAKATDAGHLLVYLNQGRHQFDDRLHRVLAGAGRPVRVYGTGRRGSIGALSFHPPGNESFVADLASCHAVISTAGNQLVGEAMHLGKPMLVLPERCVEQRLNGRAVAQMGIGLCVDAQALAAAHLQAFLRQRDAFAARMLQLRRDGLAEAVQAIEQFVHELTPRPAVAAVPQRTAALVPASTKTALS